MKDSVAQGDVSHDDAGTVDSDTIAFVTHAQRLAVEGEEQVTVDQA